MGEGLFQQFAPLVSGVASANGYDSIYHASLYLRIMRVELCPPKPKALERTVSTFA